MYLNTPLLSLHHECRRLSHLQPKSIAHDDTKSSTVNARTYNIISSEKLTASHLAEAAGYSKRTIIRIHFILRLFRSVKAPPTKYRESKGITPIILDTPFNYLQKSLNHIQIK